MTLIKWKNPLMGLEKRNTVTPSLENFFNDFISDDFMPREYASFVPSVNITENEKSYSIEANAPGFEKEDFKIHIEDGLLTISGEHKTETNKTDSNYIRKEFNYGSFTRSFNLTDLVDEENIAAKYENGILKVELPKNEVKTKNVKQIQIS